MLLGSLTDAVEWHPLECSSVLCASDNADETPSWAVPSRLCATVFPDAPSFNHACTSVRSSSVALTLLARPYRACKVSPYVGHGFPAMLRADCCSGRKESYPCQQCLQGVAVRQPRMRNEETEVQKGHSQGVT
jgi:hypothetical protein